jgi:iron complex outermembrane receptor protein
VAQESSFGITEKGMFRHSLHFVSYSGLALLTWGHHAQAQEPLEEIIVTADFRQSGLNEIAGSVSVLDAALLARRNALHLEDVLLNAPNVNLASGASRARFYQIRGIGERGQFAEPLNASVGVLIDGVDYSGIGSAALLYDVEQVEVLMGPQGTRYGSNALAGLINLQGNSPTTEFTSGLQVQAENYAGTGLAGYLSGPLGETLTARVSAQRLDSDGYNTNQYLHRPTNTRDEQALRGKLHWQAADTLSVDLTIADFQLDNGYDVFSLDNVRDTLADEPGADRQDSTLVSLRARGEDLGGVTVEAMLTGATSDTAYGYDEDWVHTGFHPWEYSSTDWYFRDTHTNSAELRLLSTPQTALLGGRTDWVTGLYVLERDVALSRVYTYLPGPFTSAYDTRRTAWYIDTNTEIGAQWTLDLGLRAEQFDAGYRDNEGVAFAPDDTLYGGKVALNYHTPGGALLYTALSRGYKTGGFNTDGTLDADLREFGEEVLWNLETGYKGSLLEGKLDLQATLFWMERQDVQISSSTIRARDDGSVEFIDYVGNAAGGFNRGLELSARYAFNSRVQFHGNLGLLDSEYDNFINSSGDNLDGRQQAHAPDYQFTAGVAWQVTPNLALDLNLQGRDAFYFSDSHNTRSKAYALLNASAQYQWRNIRLTAWGRNLGDEDYRVRGYYFGNDPRIEYAARSYTQLGEPARYGLTLNLDF